MSNNSTNEESNAFHEMENFIEELLVIGKVAAKSRPVGKQGIHLDKFKGKFKMIYYQ
jgi:hypothetical protein